MSKKTLRTIISTLCI